MNFYIYLYIITSYILLQVMDLINKFSKQRGRVIDFKEIFYGYQRVNPLFGVDYMLDMLLMYKKYRGKKMTVPVRRHAYLQQQFTGKEDNNMILLYGVSNRAAYRPCFSVKVKFFSGFIFNILQYNHR